MPGKPGRSSTGAVGVKWLAQGHNNVGNEGDVDAPFHLPHPNLSCQSRDLTSKQV